MVLVQWGGLGDVGALPRIISANLLTLSEEWDRLEAEPPKPPSCLVSCARACLRALPGCEEEASCKTMCVVCSFPLSALEGFPLSFPHGNSGIATKYEIRCFSRKMWSRISFLKGLEGCNIAGVLGIIFLIHLAIGKHGLAFAITS